MGASTMTTSILTIKDIRLGVDRCPLCESELAERAFQRKVKKRVPVRQLSRVQLLALGPRAGRGDVEIVEVVGEIPILACTSDNCPWGILAWAQDELLLSQPGIPEIPACKLGHQMTWRLRSKVGHRLDVQCSSLIPDGTNCPIRASIWLAAPGGFLAGSPSMGINQTKAHILAALSESPDGLHLRDIVNATGLNVTQVSAGLDRYRKARSTSIERHGLYPAPPNGREVYHYVLTDYGERWIAWAMGVGLMDYGGQTDT